MKQYLIEFHNKFSAVNPKNQANSISQKIPSKITTLDKCSCILPFNTQILFHISICHLEFNITWVKRKIHSYVRPFSNHSQSWNIYFKITQMLYKLRIFSLV